MRYCYKSTIFIEMLNSFFLSCDNGYYWESSTTGCRNASLLNHSSYHIYSIVNFNKNYKRNTQRYVRQHLNVKAQWTLFVQQLRTIAIVQRLLSRADVIAQRLNITVTQVVAVCPSCICFFYLNIKLELNFFLNKISKQKHL